MALKNKIDSNVTSLAYAEESSIGTLPGSPIWVPLEPNSYGDFGGELGLTPRAFIKSDRQRRKGVITDLDASGGFNSDLTKNRGLEELFQGFFFADFRRKGEGLNPLGDTTLTFSMTTAGAVFTRVGGALDLTTEFTTGDILYISGFSDPANNGVFVAGTVTATTIDLLLADGSAGAATVVTEAATANASVIDVGFESAAGDVDVDSTGSFPALTSTVLDFTTLGLVPGEWIFIGGDAADTQFATAANNGFARVRTITATRLEFDKTQSTMATEVNATIDIHIYTGRLLKNESVDTDQVRRTYNVERQLGAPDDALPAQIQSEYLVGAVPSEMSMNIGTADKVNMDLSFIAIDNEQRTGATGVKSGTRVTLSEFDALNTSSDFSRIKLAVHDDTDANPAALFAFATELSLNINNTLTPNKAVGTLGAFDVTAGNFVVGGSITAYFASVEAVTAVRNNSDITLDIHIVKDNAGISIDFPLIALGDGRLSVELDQPITIPLDNQAATGVKLDTNLDHTMLMVFWDYLPTLADL